MKPRNQFYQTPFTILLIASLSLWVGCGDSAKKSGSKKPTGDEPAGEDGGEPTGGTGGEPAGGTGGEPAGGTGGEPAGGTGGEPAGGDGGEPLDERSNCERAWDNYVEHNDVGEFLRYKSVSAGNGIETESIVKEEVLSSTDDAVKWKYTTTLMGSDTEYENEITRDMFMAGCEYTPPGAEPVEEGDETIEVPAGTFDTHWQKSVFEGAAGGTATTTYRATLDSGDEITVKMYSEADTVTGLSTTTRVLLETNKD